MAETSRMYVKNHISLIYWNIHGMSTRVGKKSISKLEMTGFKENFSGHDIICLAETKLGPQEKVFMEEYKVHSVCRMKHRKANNHSGGLVIYIKNHIQNGITLIPSSSDHIWLKADKEFFKTQFNMYICFTYISPERSQHRTEIDTLDIITKDLAKYTNLGKCLIIGDLNGYTSIWPDYNIFDSNKTVLPLPDDYVSDKPVKRRNLDSRLPNNRGKEILDLCKGTGMKIVNGRKIGDLCGKFTCYDPRGDTPSVIDYAISDVDLFDEISMFSVKPFTTFSDHCPIELKIKSDFMVRENVAGKIKLSRPPIRYMWSTNSELLYRNALNTTGIKMDINEFKQKHYEYDKNGINSATNDITSIMKKAASTAMIPCIRSTKKRRSKKSVVFDKECASIEKEIRRLCKQINNNPFDKDIRSKYYKYKRDRRKLLKLKVRESKSQLVSKLNEMYNKDPKEYWNVVKKLEELHSVNRQPCENISPNAWLDHFKKLAQQNYNANPSDMNIKEKVQNHPNRKLFSTLDFKITEQEVNKSIKHLKKNKSPGKDSILNEMIKAGQSELSPLYVKLFNMILSSGNFPDIWAGSLLTPLFKGGSINDPSDYRGISLSSCLGKLKKKIYTPYQIAFRKGRRTSDHIFVMHTMLDKYVKGKESGQNKLYVCFVDLKKAFDSVWRDALLYKLLELEIGGRFLDVIMDMFKKSTISLKLTQGLTPEFSSDTGVKQGCVISPTLFNLFLNDLPKAISGNDTDPIYMNEKALNCLMYADDIALISKSKEGLQTTLDRLSEYCNTWHLTINTNKTKIVIFNKTGRVINNVKFFINNSEIEIVKEMKYLGIIFNNNCTYNSATENLKGKALKALFKLYKSFGNIPPSVKMAKHLFDAMVKPILLYNAEIWGSTVINYFKVLDNGCDKSKLYLNSNFEKMHLKWCKYVLGVHSKSTNIAVLAELGRYPLTSEVILNLVKFWHRMCINTEDNPLQGSFKENTKMLGHNKTCYLSTVKNILHKLNLDFIFENPDKFKIRFIKKTVSEKLKLLFDNQFTADLYNDKRQNDNGNKLRTFRKYKNVIEEEKYLALVNNWNARRNITKMRISAHNLPIEAGRHKRNGKVPINERVCDLCNTKVIGDEFHIIMKCPVLRNARSKFVDKLHEIFPHFQHANEETQFVFIMQCGDADLCRVMCEFITEIVKIRGNF